MVKESLKEKISGNKIIGASRLEVLNNKSEKRCHEAGKIFMAW